MRLDARNGDTGYSMYDAKRCCKVSRLCVWCDEATAQWGEYTRPLDSRGNLTIVTNQEDRITIYIDKRLVVFNEVEDADDLAESICRDVPACAEVTA